MGLKENTLDKTIHNVVTVLFTLMLILVILQVILRPIASLTGFTMPWTEAGARTLLVVITIWAGAIGLLKNDHIVISIFLERLSPRARYLANIIVYGLIMCFVILAVAGSFLFAQRTIVGRLPGLVYLRIGHIHWILFGGYLMMGVYAIRHIIANVRKLKEIKGAR